MVEDFGTATLSGRTAHVSLDADFAAVINPNDYYLFLTEQDEHLGLAVTNRGPTGFTVTASAAVALAQGKGLASVHGTFQYRIVARHKDVAANRFAKAEIAKPIAPPAAPAKPPTAPAPSLPTLPVPRKMHTD